MVTKDKESGNTDYGIRITPACRQAGITDCETQISKADSNRENSDDSAKSFLDRQSNK